MYFQCNLLFFPAGESYKTKMTILPLLLESGCVKHLYDHLTEGCESSNDGCNRAYHNHSVRDGGRVTRNVSSEFTDLFHSFTNALKNAIDLKKTSIPELNGMLRPHKEDAQCFFRRYLKVVTTPLSTPSLCLTPRENPLRGLSFTFLGNFAKYKYASSQAKMEKLVRDLGGSILGGRVDAMAEQFDELRHAYVVLPDRTMLDIFERHPPEPQVDGPLMDEYKAERNSLKAK